MYKLLVNSPTGEQQVIFVGDGGEYFDLNCVEWDERKDGKIRKDITLGKMKRNGKVLDTLPDYLPGHAAFIADQQSKIDKQTKTAQLESDTKADGDLSLLRGMSGCEIDDWFAANITKTDQAAKLLKKIVKSLVKQNLL